jgi:cytochrome bd-type quinol oxidase subunit 2
MQKILKWAFFIIGILGFAAGVVLSVYCAWKLNGLYNAADRYNTKPWYPIRWVVVTILVTLVAGFFLGLAAAWPRKKKTEEEKAREAQKAAEKASAEASRAAAKAEKAAEVAAPAPPDPVHVTPEDGGLKVTPLPVAETLDLPEPPK